MTPEIGYIYYLTTPFNKYMVEIISKNITLRCSNLDTNPRDPGSPAYFNLPIVPKVSYSFSEIGPKEDYPEYYL